MKRPLIKITSPTFCKNPLLQKDLAERPFEVVLNHQGHHLKGDSLAEFLHDADGAIVGLEPVNDALLDRCPKLRAVAKFGVGLDNVDLAACRKRKIFVGWTPGINRRAVAEVALGFMLGMAHNLFPTSLLLKKGTWNKDGGTQLSHKTIGIIGVGNIGRELVELLRPFRCQILANDIMDLSEYAQLSGVTVATKEEIFRTADYVTLHVPLTDQTRHLINEEALALFKPESFLINTSRGPVVDQGALKKALQGKKIRGAALDVYEEEPPTDLEFLQLPNLVCTPHVSGTPYEAVLALGRSAIEHIDAFFGGRPTVDAAKA